ncbi:hypothetical protein [Azospirillum sp. TSO35-2]|uniref:hypothetical protein n=1 Tax=Azospirillum sp. TSO35-2 TaxID=716796 RepID=UPI000D615CF5|nr:hypothetical protein [Azospirillum sp. TSO35-2]PWC37513.1 hypothetical protein TSO352_08170 [Azospirillum sp. TSO35-2]
MSTKKLGRLPRVHNPRVPHLSALLSGQTLPPPPASVDYTAGLPANLGVMLNDRLGDCTCAAFYHALQVWSAKAQGAIQTQPDVDVEQLYIQACGYNPNEPGEGPGGIEQNVLTYLLNTGAPVGPDGQSRHKIAAFVEVDPRNTVDVKTVIADCGVAYIGFQVPEFILPPDQPSPAIWDVQTSDTTIKGGHAVVLAGYDDNGVRVISWGNYYTMTWAFFAQYVDEVYAIVDTSWIENGGTTPAGLTLAQLESQMAALKEAA